LDIIEKIWLMENFNEKKKFSKNVVNAPKIK
jgi:hypothetical protein